MDRPILFNPQMVRAILSGKKTQTRRVLRPQPGYVCDTWNVPYYGRNWDKVVKCPFGRKGDSLWVREAWAEVPHPGPGPKCRMVGEKGFTYRSDWSGNPSGFKWRPSIHMPREVSRITLEITDTRVERLQQINKADAAAEGITSRRVCTGDIRTGFTDVWSVEGQCDAPDARESYELLWESINGPGSWNDNPWVWVVSFRLV